MKTLSPRKARTFKQMVSLKTDNHHTKESWILLMEGNSICISNQRNGEALTASITIQRKDFNRLIDWYNKEQKTVKR